MNGVATSSDMPARVFAIQARNARTAVVFRRGPSRRVQMLRWDLGRDSIQAGQWLNARVYEHRADLSPDGRHLIFFAATHKGGPASNWTAISRPPYFTALHFYGCDHSWGGGGLFLSDRHYWVDEGGCGGLSGIESHLSSGLKRRMQRPDGLRGDRDIYHWRLERDGWQLSDETGSDLGSTIHRTWRYTRDIRRSWRLVKALTLSLHDKSPSGAAFWETHLLEGPGQSHALRDDWADVDGQSVIFAARGRLYRLPVHATGPGELAQVADLNGQSFRRVEAPYHGVQRIRG